jgi:hypothetical protein
VNVFEERINKAVEIALGHGQTDGAHHKLWVIDQMLRALLAHKYESTIAEWCGREDEWDTGIAP